MTFGARGVRTTPGLVRRLLAVALGVALVAGSAALVTKTATLGFAYRDRHRTFAPDTPLSKQCEDPPADAERITLTGADGFTLGAALVGPEDARVGLVLRQGASQRICEWLPWAAQVAEQTGARVLLFDRRGRGSSPGEGDLRKEPVDTTIAVDYLRKAGIRDVALMASSMGNSIMFSTLPELADPPCAVVSVSPVLVSGDANGTVDGSALTALPDQVWVTWENGNAEVVSNAELIAERAGAGGVAAHALEVDTADHSRQLVLNHAEVRAFLADAIGSCSG
jgi:pimeloyl-ACP methyl ester carboxylesterase